MGIVKGEGEGGGGGDGHLFWIVLLVWVGLNSSGDPGRGSSCWGSVLRKEVRLLVGLSGWGGGWFWGELGVGTWAGLGVGLNSRGKGYGGGATVLQATESWAGPGNEANLPLGDTLLWGASYFVTQS